jgi:hypothetical protein
VQHRRGRAAECGQFGPYRGRPGDADRQQGGSGRGSGETFPHTDRGLVSPLQVVDDEYHRDDVAQVRHQGQHVFRGRGDGVEVGGELAA